MRLLWDERDVAVTLGVPVTKVRELVRNADFPCIDVPGCGLRFLPERCQEWIERHARPRQAGENPEGT
jgi:hypothetical protein